MAAQITIPLLKFVSSVSPGTHKIHLLYDPITQNNRCSLLFLLIIKNTFILFKKNYPTKMQMITWL